MSPARIALLALSASPALAQTSNIDFEVGGPCSFAQASAAGLEYAAQGITFVGPAPGAGAVILDACAGLAIPPRSGSAYLVVAPGQTSSTGPVDGPVTAELNPPVARFSTWVRAEQAFGTYTVQAFSGGQMVATDTVGAFGWTPLQVGSETGIDRVVIDAVNVPGTYALEDMRLVRCPPGGIGLRFCAPPWQYAATSRSCLSAFGTSTGGGPYTSLDFRVDGGEPGLFGLVIVSRTRGLLVVPGGSNYHGAFCLNGGSFVGRFSSSLLAFDASGTGLATVDLTQVPLQPAVPVLPGETWYFQAWHREAADPSLQPTSFTDALAITFEP